MSKPSNLKQWVFEGIKYEVGEPLNEFPWEANNIYPIVCFKGKLYNALLKPRVKEKINKVRLTDIYYPNKKPYWTTADKVYNIIRKT